MNALLRFAHRADQAVWAAAGLDRLLAVLIRNRSWLTYLAVLAVIAYGADLFTFSLTIDDENHTQHQGAKLAWASQSRWGMFVLNWGVLPDPVTAFISPFIAVFAASLGLGMLVRCFDLREQGLAPWLAAPVALACPVLFYCYAFTTLGYGVGIGFFAAALGFFIFVKSSGWRRLLGFPLLGFSIAVYQPFLLVMAGFFAVYLLARILRNELPSFGFMTTWKEIAWFAAVLLLSWVFYSAIQKGFFFFKFVTPSPYLDGFLDFKPTAEYMQLAMTGAWNAAWQYYGGNVDHYAYTLWPLRLLFCFALFVVCARVLVARTSWVMKALGFACLLVMLAIPFLMHLMNSGFMPGRALLALPVVLAGVVFLAAGSSLRAVQVVMVVLVVSTYTSFAVTNNRFAFSNHMAWQADRELSTLILSRIYQLDLPEKTPHQQWTLELVGSLDYPDTAVFVRRNTIGSSFYGWANGDVRRTAAFFRTMGVFDCVAANDQQKRAVALDALDMPEWPREGSVTLVGDVIVVKLGRYTPSQVERACAGALADDEICAQLRDISPRPQRRR